VIEENGRKYLVTLHPAAGLRFPPLKALLIEDFKKVKTLVQDNE
jgi:uracil-DNA glycosylase